MCKPNFFILILNLGNKWNSGRRNVVWTEGKLLLVSGWLCSNHVTYTLLQLLENLQNNSFGTELYFMEMLWRINITNYILKIVFNLRIEKNNAKRSPKGTHFLLYQFIKGVFEIFIFLQGNTTQFMFWGLADNA